MAKLDKRNFISHVLNKNSVSSTKVYSAASPNALWFQWFTNGQAAGRLQPDYQHTLCSGKSAYLFLSIFPALKPLLLTIHVVKVLNSLEQKGRNSVLTLEKQPNDNLF